MWLSTSVYALHRRIRDGVSKTILTTNRIITVYTFRFRGLVILARSWDFQRQHQYNAINSSQIQGKYQLLSSKLISNIRQIEKPNQVSHQIFDRSSTLRRCASLARFLCCSSAGTCMGTLHIQRDVCLCNPQSCPPPPVPSPPPSPTLHCPITFTQQIPPTETIY